MKVPAAESADAMAGQLVGGRYRLGRRIGKGGMGVVYEAEHVGLDKRVAVKFLLERFTDDPEVVERFHREAKTASRIGQANIIEVHDVGQSDDGRPYLVMELLEGKDLATLLAAAGPLPAARAVRVVRQILRGLDAAHGKGIVHRDMKPENVFLVARPGDEDFVKIMDFGISKILAANESKVRLTATGAVIGTPIYMAPEQALAQAELDHRVDIYAVGVMLFELLAGRPPFLANNYLGLVTQHLNTAPPSLASFRPDLPPALVAAVARALEKDPARRFQTAAEMARALPAEALLKDFESAPTLGDGDNVRVGAHVGTDGLVAARPFGTTPDPADGAPKRRRAIWIVGGAVAVALGMVAVALGTRAGRGHGPDPVDALAAGPVPTPSPDAAPAPTPTPAPPEVVSLGKLDIHASPAGAKVYLDGEYKGPAPLLIAGVPGGTHDLRLEAAGYQTLSTTVFVTGGKTARIDDALTEIGTPPAAKVRGTSGASPRVRGTPKAGGEPAKVEPAKVEPAKVDKPDPPKKHGGRPGEKPNPYD